MEMVYCIEPRILLSQLRLYKWLSLTIAISIVPLPLDNGVTHQDAKLQMGLKPGRLGREGPYSKSGAGATGDVTKTKQCYTHNLSTGGETLPMGTERHSPIF